MSYQPFEFSQKTDYVFTQDAAEALKNQLERHKPAKLMVIASARAFKIVLVQYEMVNGVPTEVWHEVPFTLKNGILTFETEKMGVFLMVLNIVEAPTAQ